MGSNNALYEVESLNQPSGEQQSAACKASQKLSENVAGVAKDNSDINREMNNGRVKCSPPPITPPCQWEDIPPNPAIVSNRVNDMISREQSMHGNISELSPLVATDPKLAKKLDDINTQLMALEMETNKLYDMTSGGAYDEGAIDRENRVIEKLTKKLDEDRKSLSKDLGCDANDRRNGLVAQEHETVSCEVNMKPKEVWKQIGKFDTLPWHPGIEPTSASVNGNIRELTAVGGVPKFKETLIEDGKDRKTGVRYYTYQMTEGLPVQPISTLKVEPSGKGSRITWTADMDLSTLNEETANAVENGIKGFYQQGLSALLEKLNKK